MNRYLLLFITITAFFLNNRALAFYDPNDKQVYPTGVIDSTEWLTYTVHFQNTGNDTARHIYIADTLDANLDFPTFELLTYSHLPSVHNYGNGAVKFSFPNICLPDSNVNEPLSHGYVQYRVKLKDNLPLGTQIHNTAYIYFDFNAPVVTNTTINTITANIETDIAIARENIEVKVFPNPASTQLTISAAGFIPQSTTVYDVNGRRITEQKFAPQLDISNLANGVYLVELKTGNTAARTRFVKM